MAERGVDRAEEAIALARGWAPDAVKTLHEIACSTNAKPVSAYVRCRAAAAMLEVAGLIKAGPSAEPASEGGGSA